MNRKRRVVANQPVELRQGNSQPTGGACSIDRRVTVIGANRRALGEVRHQCVDDLAERQIDHATRKIGMGSKLRVDRTEAGSSSGRAGPRTGFARVAWWHYGDLFGRRCEVRRFQNVSTEAADFPLRDFRRNLRWNGGTSRLNIRHDLLPTGPVVSLRITSVQEKYF